MRTFTESQVAKMFTDLYHEIKHGDPEHQAWLKKKMEEFSASHIFPHKGIDHEGRFQELG